ncbi:hypothetical protein OCF07_01565 [Bacillus pacificus]|uniref:hypothetical protein n=1 Tax=Bacillus cereus group sp. TH153LC TaxID=3018059 RepID=UPI001D0DC44B|nr:MULTISPECIES: hypothetical protein [Bacillus cereus group]MCC2352888.1 hypothetical protein [Bacillus pacificus]MCC2464808.1 hypothetical protein [Bacillus pacificus]MCU5246369.1 hypothetical protein [Bacillus pacificus]MCU5416139.1 hypothetical protein [Bacillus pacificus]MCU5463858.1 hypothetical protein [Bacillus pacificus]
MPITNRFSTTTNGALAITGNTLGLSKISNLNRAGTIGAIGAFATTNTTLQVTTFPAGTTLHFKCFLDYIYMLPFINYIHILF